MPRLSRSALSLRFGGDDLDPDRLTQMLGASPSRAAPKDGVRHVASDGRVRTAPTGMWALEAPDSETGDLDAQVRHVLSQLTDDLAVWRELALYKPDVLCGLFMREEDEGLELAAETLKMLGDRGIRIGLCLYAPTED